MIIGYSFVLIGVLVSSSLLTDGDSYTVRVCQNKSCCKKNPYLLETVYDLVGVGSGADGIVEPSGCLSNCDKGPNMEVEKSGTESKLINGIDDSTMASVQLELALDVTFPKLLVAAAKVMERAAKSKDPSEQELFLSSVINKLQASDKYAESTAITRAYALRSKVFLKQSKWSQAILDAQNAISLLDKASSKTVAMAYRSWVDAEEGQGSHPARVIPILQAWFKAQPEFRTKLKGEITQWVQRTR